MSSAAPLARHPLTRAQDVDQARTGVAGHFCDHALDVIGPGPLSLVHNGSRIGNDVGINYIRYGASVRIVPRDMSDFFLLQLPLRGRALVQAQGTVISSDRRRGSLLGPDDGADLRFAAGYEQLVVHVRRSAVDAAAAQEGHQGSVRFRPEVVLESPAVRNLGRLVQFAIDLLDDDQRMLAAPAAANALEQTVIHALLAAQPNSTWSDEPLGLSSRAVRATVEMIEADPASPWTVSSLAQRAGVAPRTLQNAFRQQIGTPPTEVLRLARLRRAREELLEATPGETSVSDVAARWGLFHLGRFARAYLMAFGELPSETLAQ